LILKKSLGQHFLKDDSISQRIVSAIKQQPVQQLLEVGPGAGALTKHLIKLPGINFKAVEIDDEKIDFLQKTFPELQLIHESFLNIQPPFDGPFSIIGNFPYNISTEILFKTLDWRNQVQMIVGMFQKEVAERIAAPPGSKIYGVTSILIQAFFKVEYLFDVPPSSFNPPPNVMSGVIRLLPVEKQLEIKSERSFRVLVKTAFNQRRKMLRNAVKSLFTQEVLQQPVFDKRAEQLSKEDFAMLTFQMI
jgi:16S rRNA (adenine1518-N6/adenine1519-N6)-dimethyltransferase